MCVRVSVIEKEREREMCSVIQEKADTASLWCVCVCVCLGERERERERDRERERVHQKPKHYSPKQKKCL